MKTHLLKYLSLLTLALLTLPLRAQMTTFNATGGNQTYNVTANGTLTITAVGAAGGTRDLPGGTGATVMSTFAVQQGDQLTVVVGESSNRGAGGGGTAVIIDRASNKTLLVVAGGGGGGGGRETGGGGGRGLGGTAAGGGSDGGGGGGGGFNSPGTDGSLSNFGSGGSAGTLNGGSSGGVGRGNGGFGFGGGGGSGAGNPGGGGGGGGGYDGGTGATNGVGASGGGSFVQTADFVGMNTSVTPGVDGGGPTQGNSPGPDGSVLLNFEAAPLVALGTPEVTNVDCNGTSTGEISVTASGGTAPFTYTLTPGGTQNMTGTFTGLAAGTNYAVSVTDNAGSMDETDPITITEPTALSVSISGNTSVLFGFGENCTTLTASGEGGTEPYSYSWSSGANPANTATSEVCPGQNSQTYTVTVTDDNGCTTMEQVTVNVNDVSCGRKGNKVTICYYGVTQCVSEKIAKRYLRLGATIGGCNSSSNARIGVEESTELPLQLALKAFPNPVQDAVTVEVLSSTAGMGTFEVLDLTGRTRQTRSENLVEGLNQIELRLGTLPTGLYLIRATDAQNRQGVVKVSKQ